MVPAREVTRKLRSFFMVKKVTSFISKRHPYFLGFCVIEAGIYYFNGPTGNFTTGFLGLFTVWIYYAWMSSK
jgi:hypothetical protein